MKRGTCPDWPLGLLGMVGGIVAVELFVKPLVPVLTVALVMEWRETRGAAVREVLDCDWLCFGSSMVKNGVLPKVIESRTGRRGYNLALPGGTPPASYFLFRRALDQGARPSAVAVDFHFTQLLNDPCVERMISPWAHLLGYAEALDLGRHRGDLTFLGHLLVARMMPTVRARHEIRAAFLLALDDRPVSQVRGGAIFARNRRVNRGALVQPRNSAFRDEAVPPNLPDESASWTCHPANAHYIEAFLRLAAARGITVYWLMPPLPPGHQTRFDRALSEESYGRFVDQLVERYPNLTIVDGRHAGFPPPVFIDPVHLDRAGALALSESLATLMARRPKSQWVDLPHYDETADAQGLEDSAQSALAVNAAWDRARR